MRSHGYGARCRSVETRRQSLPHRGKGIGQTQALNAVKNAAQLRKFRVVSTHGNVVKLAYPSGPRAQKFEAQFDVVYEGSKIAVKYASSRGLDAGPCQNDAKQICLHRNVNKWMANLASDITKRAWPRSLTQLQNNLTAAQ